jgi:hypothetical protein
VSADRLSRCKERQDEADRLGRQVDVSAVPLIEDEVEHAQHRPEIAGLVEWQPRDPPLGPADPLAPRL